MRKLFVVIVMGLCLMNFSSVRSMSENSFLLLNSDNSEDEILSDFAAPEEPRRDLTPYIVGGGMISAGVIFVIYHKRKQQ